MIFPCPEHLSPKGAKGKKSKTYYEYFGHYASMVHALSSLVLATIVLKSEGVHFGQETSFIAKIAVLNSMGYFIYDAIYTLYAGFGNFPIILHHVMAIIMCGIVFLTGKNGNEYSVILIVGELSNPCNLIREIMKHFKKDNTRAYLQVSLGFVGIFIIMRFVVCPIWVIQMYPAPSDIIFKVAGAIVWFVSWHWLFIIFNFALKEMKKAITKKDAKTQQAST